MKLKAFSVYDAVAEAFLQPFFVKTAGQATRSFAQAVNQANHPFNQNPDDYTLFEIGSFDEDSGFLEALPTPHSHGLAVEFVEARPTFPAGSLSEMREHDA